MDITLRLYSYIHTAQVAILDEAIGNITQALKDTGMWDNTVIIFSSDNGGMVPPAGGVGCNYPLRGGKITVWEGGTQKLRVKYICLLVYQVKNLSCCVTLFNLLTDHFYC